MLLKILWSIVACFTFSLGCASMLLMLVFMTSQESVYALISLGAGLGGIAFAIQLFESEVM